MHGAFLHSTQSCSTEREETTPPLHESTLWIRKVPCAEPARLSHKTSGPRSPSGARTTVPSLAGLRDVVHIVRKALESSPPATGAFISRRPLAPRRLITFFAFASPCGCTCGAPGWRRSRGPNRSTPPRSARRSAVSPGHRRRHSGHPGTASAGCPHRLVRGHDSGSTGIAKTLTGWHLDRHWSRTATLQVVRTHIPCLPTQATCRILT